MSCVVVVPSRTCQRLCSRCFCRFADSLDMFCVELPIVSCLFERQSLILGILKLLAEGLCKMSRASNNMTQSCLVKLL